jgi:hypothetical protein
MPETAPGTQPGAQPGAAPGTTPEAAPTSPDAFAQAPRAGTGGEGSYSPNMLGDQLSSSSSRQFPFAVRSSFKIAENESPRPEDRLFVTYNYFNRINNSPIDVHRETIGFEKTFLEGNASIGLRAPFLQETGEGTNTSQFGDLTIILKGALLNDPCSGNVLAGGLAVTAPTAGGVADTPIHPTLLQPWVGGILGSRDLYVHGFSSILIPTDDRDVTVWFNDIGIGYFLYRNRGCGCDDRLLTAIVPTFEVHVTTPLNHRGSEATPVGLQDIVDLTFGTWFGIGKRSWLATAIVTPVTGPKPFDVEAQVYFNFGF